MGFVFRIAATLHFNHGRFFVGDDGIDFIRLGQGFEFGFEFRGVGTEFFKSGRISFSKACVGDFGDEFGIADEEEVIADAVAAISGNEGECFGLCWHFEIEDGGFVFAEFELLELHLGIDEDGEVCFRGCSLFGGSEADETGEAHGFETALFTEFREIKGDAAVCMHGEHAVSFCGVVDVTDFSAALGV